MKYKKERLEELKEKGKEKFEALKEWAKRNKKFLMFAIPLLLSGIIDCVKISAKRAERRREEDRIYDRSGGHYYYPKHISSNRKRNKTYLEIDRRKARGEHLGDILEDMDLI